MPVSFLDIPEISCVLLPADMPAIFQFSDQKKVGHKIVVAVYVHHVFAYDLQLAEYFRVNYYQYLRKLLYFQIQVDRNSKEFH